MKTYKIKQTSLLLWSISFLFTVLVGEGIVIVLVINNVIHREQFWLIFILIALVFYLAFKVPRYLATVDIELIMDQDGLKKKWLKQFMFCNKPEVDIKWTEVQDYVIQPDRQFDKFRITLKDGSKFQFYHNNEHTDDNFLTFLRHFEQRITQLNADNEITNKIKRRKTIYETNWGLALAVVAILFMIAIPTTLFLFPKVRPNYVAIGITYSSAIYFLSQVYTYRRQNKENS